MLTGARENNDLLYMGMHRSSGFKDLKNVLFGGFVYSEDFNFGMFDFVRNLNGKTFEVSLGILPGTGLYVACITRHNKATMLS